MSEPARHEGTWGEVPRRDQGEAQSGVPPRNVPIQLTAVDPDRELPETATASEVGKWPGDATDSGMYEPADRLGRALGSAAVQVRHIRENLRDRLDDLRQQFHLIRGRAAEDAREAADDLERDTKRNVREIRSRAQHLAHEYPIHFVLASAATAFVVGFVLGWWRKRS